jgi:stage V sporulation protein AC
VENENAKFKEYQDLAKKHQPKPKVLLNCLKAFLVGGLICLLGELLQKLYMSLNLPLKVASSTTVASLILLSCILTGLGVYDRIGQWAGAGTAVPVTGFANSISSAALEHQAEGYVLGVGGNMFKLAGSVIVFGVVTAFFVGIIWSIFHL